MAHKAVDRALIGLCRYLRLSELLQVHDHTASPPQPKQTMSQAQESAALNKPLETSSRNHTPIAERHYVSAHSPHEMSWKEQTGNMRWSEQDRSCHSCEQGIHASSTLPDTARHINAWSAVVLKQ